MDIIAFQEAATTLGVSLTTISRWVQDGKLMEGPKAGKNKTVTRQSLEQLAASPSFQIGFATEKKPKPMTIIAESDCELESLKKRVAELEAGLQNALQEIEKLRNFTQNCNTLRNVATATPPAKRQKQTTKQPKPAANADKPIRQTRVVPGQKIEQAKAMYAQGKSWRDIRRHLNLDRCGLVHIVKKALGV